MRRPALLLLVPLATLAAAPRARADGPPSGDADALFQEGRARMEQGDLAGACPLLEKSFQLAPRLGTMLNLGACFERSGHLARALGIYERAATMAREAGRADRERAARELAAAVEPRVAHLVLIVEEPAADLVVSIGGEPMTTRGGISAIDPGERALVASASGKEPFSASIAARAGETVRVTIPRLAAAAPAPPGASAAPARGAEPAPPAPRASPARTVLVVSGIALGVAGIAAGTALGLRAKSKWDASGPHCDASGCDADGESLVADARTAGDWATVAFVAGGVGLAAAAVCALAWPTASRRVSVAVGAGGLGVRGSF